MGAAMPVQTVELSPCHCSDRGARLERRVRDVGDGVSLAQCARRGVLDGAAGGALRAVDFRCANKSRSDTCGVVFHSAGSAAMACAA